MQLEDLPLAVLERIVGYAAENDFVRPSTLVSELGHTIRDATYAHYVRTLNIEDDDNAMYEAEQGLVVSLLTTVLSNERIAQHVRRVVVHKPANPQSVPLDSHAIQKMVARSSIKAFEWYSNRPPSTPVIDALAASTQLEVVVVAPVDKAVRWDAGGLTALPTTLTSLHVANLSSEGASNLKEALCELASLESLTLESTPYIDDSVLLCAADNLKKLQHLTIRDMSGTKLTDIGIKAVLSQSRLVSLSLHSVEGRLSKTCWLQCELPATLKRLRVSFIEWGTHKSWAADHLNSLHNLIGPSLEDLQVTRIVSNDPAKTRSDVVRLRPIPEELLDALVDSAASFTKLNIDFWTVSSGQLKALLEAACRVVSLQVTLDDTFKNITGLAPAVSAARCLRELVVSIPEWHMPEKILSPTSSPVLHLSTLSGPAERTAGLTPEQEGLIPPLKELKRFIRRSKIERLAWIGHTGLGEWQVTRQGLTNVKLDFVPASSSSAKRNSAGDNSAGNGDEESSRSTIVMATPSSPTSTPLRPKPIVLDDETKREQQQFASPAASITSTPYSGTSSLTTSPYSLESLTLSTSSSSGSEVSSFIRGYQAHGVGVGVGIGSRSSVVSMGLGLDGMSSMIHALDETRSAPQSHRYQQQSAYQGDVFSSSFTTTSAAAPATYPLTPPGLGHYGLGTAQVGPPSLYSSPPRIGQQLPSLESSSILGSNKPHQQLHSSPSRGVPSTTSSMSPSAVGTGKKTASTSNGKKASAGASHSESSSSHHQHQQHQHEQGQESNGQQGQGGNGGGRKKRREERRRLGGTNIGFQRGKPRNSNSK